MATNAAARGRHTECRVPGAHRRNVLSESTYCNSVGAYQQQRTPALRLPGAVASPQKLCTLSEAAGRESRADMRLPLLVLERLEGESRGSAEEFKRRRIIMLRAS